jgi:putative transposase
MGSLQSTRDSSRRRMSDGGQVKGRKRHIMINTDGRLLAVEVHPDVPPADIQDRDGAKGVLKRSRARFPFVEKVYVDGGYVALEIVKRPPGAKGFVVIRRRWIVERIFAWIMKCRRLVRDY